MLSPDQARARAQQIVADAAGKGADAADAYYSASASTEIGVRLGQLEQVQSSEDETMSLRVFVGQRTASVSSASMNPDLLAAMVDRAVEMARAAPEDPYATLAPADMLLKGEAPDVDGDDGGSPDPAALREAARACEEAARAVPGVTNSEGGGASAGRSIVALATSHGFAGSRQATSYSLSAAVVAEADGVKESDYALRSWRHREDCATPEEIGRLAGERTVSRLGTVRLSSGAMPVILDPRVGGSLLGSLAGAMSGSAIARKTSFLLGKDGERVFPEGISIIDDPLRPRGLASRGFDGEGLPTARTYLVKDGVLGDWLCDASSAKQLGRKPTGHASLSGGLTTTNLHLEPGRATPEELMADVKLGVYITHLIGQGVNPVTGDYSRGASGFIIRDGQRAEPVNEITVAGNLYTMFATLTAANDLAFTRATNVPTLRIDGMTVAG